jgi:hypothetical protein
MASQVNTLLREIFSPVALGLGTSVSYTDVSRRLLELEFVSDLPILDIKEMELDPEITGGTDRICGRFLGIEDEETETCTYQYKQFIDRTSAAKLVCPDSTSAFRLFRSIVSFTSVIDSSTLTYTYEDQYDIQ